MVYHPNQTKMSFAWYMADKKQVNILKRKKRTINYFIYYGGCPISLLVSFNWHDKYSILSKGRVLYSMLLTLTDIFTILLSSLTSKSTYIYTPKLSFMKYNHSFTHTHFELLTYFLSIPSQITDLDTAIQTKRLWAQLPFQKSRVVKHFIYKKKVKFPHNIKAFSCASILYS